MPQVAEQIAKLKTYDTIADTHLVTAMRQSVTHMVRPASEAAPVFRGVLRNSITSDVKHLAVLDIVGRVYSSLKDEAYPAVMEAGRKPGTMPPPQALERWVRLKLGVSEAEASKVAFAVARKIARRGIRGRRFMRRAYQVSNLAIHNYFRAAILRIEQALAAGRR